MKKKSGIIKYVLSFLFLALLIGITFVVIFNKYEFKDIYNVIKSVDIKYVLIAITMILIYILFESCATKTILSSLGIKSSLFHNIEYSSVDYYFCAITPSASGGQPMVLYYMSKDRIPITHSSQTLLINTALFKIVLIILTLVSIIFSRSGLLNSNLLILLLVFGFVINAVIITVCFLGSFKNEWVERIGKRIILLLAKIKLVKHPLRLFRKFTTKMEEYAKGAELLRRNKLKFFFAFIFNMIQRVALFSIAYFIYLSFLKPYPQLKGFNYIDLFAIQVIIAMAVDSLPLPGGMGISEYLYSVSFETIYLLVDSHCVASAMLLTRAVSFYIPLILTSLIVVIKQIRVIIKGRKKLTVVEE